MYIYIHALIYDIYIYNEKYTYVYVYVCVMHSYYHNVCTIYAKQNHVG